jgi:hypothetical protein
MTTVGIDSGKGKAFVLAASLLFLILSIGSIRTESITSNEVLFIPAGLSYLERQDARMDIEEPPLVKLIAAIPALVLHARVDYNDSSWTANPGAFDPEYSFGSNFFGTWNRDHGVMLFLARLPMIGLSLLLGLSLYWMARQLAGPWGAVVTLVLFVTSPFFLAYGSIAHTDVPIAFFSLWTMWSFATLWQKPSKRNALLFTASLAAALLTKFSGAFLLPSIFLAWCWFWYRGWRSRGQSSQPSATKTFPRERLALGAMLLAGLIVYVFYLGAFHRSDSRLLLENEMNSMVGIRTLPVDILIRRMNNHPWFEPWLLPPSLYAGGLAYVVGHGRRPMYFLGHWYPHGVWFYFPVISFFKLAPGMIFIFLLLALLAIKRLLNTRAQASIVPESVAFHLGAVVAGLIVFAATAMASNLNVGIRHFSVPITCAVLLASLVVPLTRSVVRPRVQPFLFAAVAALVLSSLGTALLTYPHYLAYFNIFRLDTAKQEIAQNSNLSWGQSMKEVAAFFREHGVSDPYVDEGASNIDPTVYVPGAHVWNCESPDPIAPEWVAISAYMLIPDKPQCLALERYPSWTIGDGAVKIFHVTEPTSLNSKPR